jgi:hypothetical protein
LHGTGADPVVSVGGEGAGALIVVSVLDAGHHCSASSILAEDGGGVGVESPGDVLGSLHGDDFEEGEADTAGPVGEGLRSVDVSHEVGVHAVVGEGKSHQFVGEGSHVGGRESGEGHWHGRVGSNGEVLHIIGSVVVLNFAVVGAGSEEIEFEVVEETHVGGVIDGDEGSVLGED